MDSLANYGSDGDNSNNSDDTKVTTRNNYLSLFILKFRESFCSYNKCGDVMVTRETSAICRDGVFIYFFSHFKFASVLGELIYRGSVVYESVSRTVK